MSEKATLKIHKETFPFLNIAMYLHNIKPIRSLSIENDAETDTDSIKVNISSDIDFIVPFSFDIHYIPARKDMKIALDNLNINRAFFNTLSEVEKAIIKIEILEKDVLLASEHISIYIHPLEYFGGFQLLPELIATFVTPNHSYIYHIKKKAIDILERQGLRTAFEGYQSDNRQRVMDVISAIYTAIISEEIVYDALPPGYEEAGQRLRLLNTIVQQKFGNCIDISLLFIACLESIGLNPILIIVRGHAFIGCWLCNDKFSEVVNVDKTAITKRFPEGIREIVVVEATSVCRGANVTFVDALNKAEAQLVEKQDFLLSIDIKRARALPVRPLPLLNNTSSTQLDEEATHLKEPTEMYSRFQIGTVYQDQLPQDNQTITKLEIWKRKLLDLSLRNNLLNLHITRNMLQLVDVNIKKLVEYLFEGKNFTIDASPTAKVLDRYHVFTTPLHPSSELYKNANRELERGHLLTNYNNEDLNNILVYIKRNANIAVEENGYSTLYIALGLLKWYDKKTPDKERYSPILLLPVDIIRRSANSNFTLKIREEEMMINVTLVEFLRQEFELTMPGLETLPKDEKGVMDVNNVMTIFRTAVIPARGWDVYEQIILGNFSFSKFILWKDIADHQNEILKSNMVRSLVEGKLVLNTNDKINTKNDFDKIPSHSLVLPVLTDVSQMEAVLTAQQGCSFILHGPPGTGKSQTITNIIADALYHGKRVLFVAAKKAALDVVHRRLKEIGLEPFVLELHSNKSKKSAVLNQMARTIEIKKLTQTFDFKQKAERLDEAKKVMSDYINVLHQKQQIGSSLYDSIVALENYTHHNFPRNLIPASVLQQLNETLWQQWTDWLPIFQAIITQMIHPSENPLSALNVSQYSSLINKKIFIQTQAFLKVLSEVQIQSQQLMTAIHFPFSIHKKNEVEQFFQVISALQNLSDMSLELVLYLSNKENNNTYKEWSRVYQQYLNILNNILKDYNRNVLAIDVAVIAIQWKKAQKSWFLMKWLKKRKVRKILSAYRNDSFISDIQIEQLFLNYNHLKELQTLLQQNHFVAVQQSLKHLFKGEQTDLSDLDKKATWVQQVNNLTNNWGTYALGKWIQILQSNDIHYVNDLRQHNASSIVAFIQSIQTFNEQKKDYEILTGIDFQQNDNGINEMMIQFKNILEHLPQLQNWMNYTRVYEQGASLHLQWFLESYKNKICNVDNIIDYFYYTVHISIAESIILQHESLSLFNVMMFEQAIEQYKKNANDFYNITRNELLVKLTTQLHNMIHGDAQSSEMAILQKAIRSNGRGVSIRRLFDQIPILLPHIAPCMLMSPISLAQYFDVSKQHFDIVIFDEASQLPTCEAVSALARAKQSVIVGDPKQMPPTAFFNMVRLDEENIEMEDLESILDDCLSLSIPSKYLLRHYRSKHESLISFSNVNYYESKLLTFPSADDLNCKVKYHHVPGYYDKARSRTNESEANAIVVYIKSHYKINNKLSVGVVTFNAAQQNLIEDKLQQVFKSDSNLEESVNKSDEPLFIKNLENVQGDERDIILFSVCYAPDEEGRMSMNFGPLNHDGGWRRLNVAITRARFEMHLFATLKADQIDLNRTAAEGVAGLKSFMQFAESGHLRLSIRPEDVQEVYHKKHLSEKISKLLQEKGLQVQYNIGTSDFKVDIGIVHPDKPQQYILGIIVDGYYYYHTRTINDREIVMPAVLKALGWNMYRIWTIDWYNNANNIIENIVEKVKQLQMQSEVKDKDEVVKKLL